MQSSVRRRRALSLSSSSGSDSDSDNDDDQSSNSVPPLATHLLQLPVGGMRRQTGAIVRLPTSNPGGEGPDGITEDEDGVMPLQLPPRPVSRRDSRRCGFAHELAPRKEQNVQAMRDEANAQRQARRHAEEISQAEAERCAKVEAEGICVSELLSMFSHTHPRPGTECSSPDAVADRADDPGTCHTSPPWSDGGVADTTDGEVEVEKADEDPIGNTVAARQSTLQFAGWTKFAARSPTPSEVDLHRAPIPGHDAVPCAEVSASSIAQLGAGPKPQQQPEPEPEPEPQPEPHPQQQLESEPEPPKMEREGEIGFDTDAAPPPRRDWTDLGSECAEVGFVDEIRARQIEHMVGTGRLPVAIASARGYHTPRAPSPRSGRSRSGGRQSGRFLAQRDAASAAPNAVAELAPHVPAVPRPPPPRPTSGAHHHSSRHRGGRPLARANVVC
jgi:hypothetical protein